VWAVPESATPPVDLPVSAPPPWPARVRATLWWHRATLAARALGPEGAVPLTVGIVVDYLHSPVGPYREVLASPVLRRGPLPTLVVPFIAVDSAASAHGGRVHWDLPKTLAAFAGDVTRTAEAVGTGEPAWHVRTTVRGSRVPLPIAGALRFAQPLPGGGLGVATARLAGRGRAARVTVDTAGPSLPAWLTPGQHPGLVITAGRMTTGRQRRRRA
jgi:hypothetical protein